MPLATENSADYDRGDYEHDRAYLCDTSGVDPYTGLTFDSSNCDVDHIVAAKEAHESGGYNWSVATRQQFGNDELNLVATRACVNRSKGSRDAAEWSGLQSGACAGATLTTEGRRTIVGCIPSIAGVGRGGWALTTAGACVSNAARSKFAFGRPSSCPGFR